MPPKKKQTQKQKPKAKPTQKQKQRQSQKIVINLAPPRKRTRKPRATARPNSARVLNQFISPESMFPHRTIFPVSLPQPFAAQSMVGQSPILINEVAPRPAAVKQEKMRGRDTTEVAFGEAVRSGDAAVRAAQAGIERGRRFGRGAAEEGRIIDITGDDETSVPPPEPLSRQSSGLSAITTMPTPITASGFSSETRPMLKDPFAGSFGGTY